MQGKAVRAGPGPQPRLGVLERAFRPCETVAAVVAGLMMATTMLATTVDALLRYSINAPLTFNYYLTENYLMVGMLVLPLAWGFRHGGYIRIGALTQALPAAFRDVLLRAGLLVSGIYCAALAWYAFRHFLGTYQRGDVQMGVIDWPVWLSWIWIPVGMGLFAIRLLLTGCGPGRDLGTASSDLDEDGT